ncbi:DUF1918 domain-containing protein [Miltoncostaea oceani]|uniref:DUF1918 domain-containing protein n=1 Tax=Miltoncostaea oceani TaxID=2843216 RepID=UPI001C3E4198|nr:DUF1918 domain-containing protein [Miltoncostaea oceani]
MSRPGTDERLRTTPVRDAMTTEIVTCTADVPLMEVAALMAAHRIHSVVVLAPPGSPRDDSPEVWGVLQDIDLVAGASWSDQFAGAGTIAASPRVVVSPDDSLAAAALAMSENAVGHVLVTEPGAAAPVGILSALDIARAMAPLPDPGPRVAPDRAAVRPGDRLVITAHQQGGRPRDAEVLEARGPGGGPPYLVRWEDDGRVTLHYPGSDAQIQRLSRT